MKKFMQLTLLVPCHGSPWQQAVERRSYIAKHKLTREAKTKIYLSIYELFTNRYLKSYIAIAMSRRALTKWRVSKVTPLQIEAVTATKSFYTVIQTKKYQQIAIW